MWVVPGIFFIFLKNFLITFLLNYVRLSFQINCRSCVVKISMTIFVQVQPHVRHLHPEDGGRQGRDGRVLRRHRRLQTG
jgi:hypothetical protein